MLLKKDVYNAKIKNIEDKISDITKCANINGFKCKILTQLLLLPLLLLKIKC